jgi:hypothetical protein
VVKITIPVYSGAGAVRGTERRISYYPVIEQAVKDFHIPRVWRFAVSESAAAKPPLAGFARAKRAFCSGTVKNQQGENYNPGVFRCRSSAGNGTPDFSLSRDRASSERLSRSARLAIRRKRICGGKAAVSGLRPRQTRVLQRYREKSIG